MERVVEIKDLDELREFAREFAKRLNDGDCVVLTGDLGSGKTTFVKELCKNFGIENVTSPSFAIINEYENERKIYHLDFYRIKRWEELINIGYFELIQNEEAIKFIEWGDLFSNVLPSKRIELKFEIVEEDKRKITIEEH